MIGAASAGITAPNGLDCATGGRNLYAVPVHENDLHRANAIAVGAICSSCLHGVPRFLLKTDRDLNGPIALGPALIPCFALGIV